MTSTDYFTQSFIIKYVLSSGFLKIMFNIKKFMGIELTDWSFRCQASKFNQLYISLKVELAALNHFRKICFDKISSYYYLSIMILIFMYCCTYFRTFTILCQAYIIIVYVTTCECNLCIMILTYLSGTTIDTLYRFIFFPHFSINLKYHVLQYFSDHNFVHE